MFDLQEIVKRMSLTDYVFDLQEIVKRMSSTGLCV